MERNLLTLVGDGVDPRLIDALGEKIALGVVATEETEELVIDLVLEPSNVDRIVRQTRAQLLHLGQRFGISAERLCLLDSPGQFPLQLRLICRLVVRKGSLHLRQQILIEELVNLLTLRVHDSVEPEVEIWLVELEQLSEQFLQLGVVLRHKD